MKRIFRKTLIILVVYLFVSCFASCGNAIKGDEAKMLINDFFDAIVAEDYDKAESFLHPERPADLETFLQDVEEKERIDFQKGIKIEKYTNFSTSMYDSTVDGSTYKLSIKTIVVEQEVKFTIKIVKNDEGYGIYNFDIDT